MPIAAVREVVGSDNEKTKKVNDSYNHTCLIDSDKDRMTASELFRAVTAEVRGVCNVSKTWGCKQSKILVTV